MFAPHKEEDVKNVIICKKIVDTYGDYMYNYGKEYILKKLQKGEFNEYKRKRA